LLPSRQKHVHFTSGWIFRDFVGQFYELVCGVTSGTDHHQNMISLLAGANGLSSRSHDPIGRRNTGTAKFLHDETQGNTSAKLRQLVFQS
jgi:hypothetical protein